MSVLLSVFVASSVSMARPPSIDEPLRTGASASSDAAVVVGVEDYAFLPKVPHAARDARAVYNTLLYTRGIPAEKIRLLNGANKDQIVDAVAKASADVGSGGTLWVYFAGHGAASSVDGSLMLVGDDAKRDPAVFQSRSVSVDSLTKTVGVQTNIILDTCYAGVGRDGTELMPGTRFAVPSFATANQANVRVWTAASASEISVPYTPVSHGLFTYFVVGAMRGWADGELSGQTDQQVSMQEAHAYVSRALSTLNTSGQRPQLTASDASAAVLASGRLEQGPALTSLPIADNVIVTAPASAANMGEFVAPFSFVSGSLYSDAMGQSLRWNQLVDIAGDQVDALAVKKKHQGGQTLATAGMVTAGVGVVGALASFAAHASKKASYKSSYDFWHDTNPDFVEDDPGSLNAGVMAAWVGVTGGGIGMTVGGKLIAKKQRQKMADVATEIATRY